MLEAGTSSEARIGQILLLIGIIIDVIGVFVIFALDSIFSVFNFPNLVVPFYIRSILIVLGLIALAGLATGIYAFQQLSAGKARSAGKTAVIACLLPPLDIIMLIAAIFILISPETRK